jgi:nanoRNase/pAp phosphatase (c-di-AMP/oligoRNAs hydrolase)
LKVAEKLQGGGHPNACGATLPRSVKTDQDAINYLRQVLNPRRETSEFNSLESVFDALEKGQR